MAPKRRAAASNGPVSASQPTPSRPNTRAAGRKRRMSDADVSDAESAVSNTSSKVSKTAGAKRKRVTVEIEREVIIEEAENQSEGDAAPICDQDGEPQDEVIAEEEEDQIEISQPSKRQRLSVKRKTLSPSKESKTIRTSRTSLLAGLQDGVDNTQTIGEFTFSPLATVVERRMQERQLASPNHRIEGEDDSMSDRLVLDTHDEFVYPQLGASATPVAPDATPRANPNRVSSRFDDERREFQNAVITFQKAATEATAKLQVMQMEVKALGFGDDALTGTETDAEAAEIVLRSIRESMENARAFLDEELPGSLPDDASNQDIVQVLNANVREFANRLRKADQEGIKNAELTTDLARQIDDLLTTVADEMLKYGQLKKDSALNTERLTASLDHYRDAEQRLLKTVTDLEQQHRDTVSKMNKEREMTVRELEESADKASELAATRLDQVESLQDQVQTVTKERDDLDERLAATEEQLNDAIEDKDQAMTDLVEKEAELEEVADRVKILDEELTDQKDAIENLRTFKDSEHSQRVTAESALDDKTQEVEELNDKIHAAGVEANGLRIKIYELQNKTEKLEDEAVQRGHKHEQELADEVSRREDATRLADERETTITDLQNQLQETEDELRELLTERDKQIADLKDAVDQKDAAMQGMEEDHDAELAQKDETIATLQDSINDYDNSLRNSQQETNDYKVSLRERDATIAELECSIANLEAEKLNLEDRVSKEAMDMLEIQNAFNKEIGKLKAQLEDRAQKLQVVLEKRAEESKAMAKLEEARDAEMAALKVDHATEMALRKDEFDELKGQFADFIRNVKDGLERRQEERRAIYEAAEEDDEALKNTFLQQLAALNVPTAAPNGVLAVASQHKINGVKKPQRKSKRLVDSGIGLEGGEVSMLSEEDMMVV